MTSVFNRFKVVVPRPWQAADRSLYFGTKGIYRVNEGDGYSVNYLGILGSRDESDSTCGQDLDCYRRTYIVWKEFERQLQAEIPLGQCYSISSINGQLAQPAS